MTQKPKTLGRIKLKQVSHDKAYALLLCGQILSAFAGQVQAASRAVTDGDDVAARRAMRRLGTEWPLVTLAIGRLDDLLREGADNQ